MSRGRWLAPVGLLALAGGLAWYVSANVEVTTDVAHLLTSVEDRTRAQLIAALSESELARTLIVSVSGRDGDEAAAAAAVLAQRLAAHPEVAWLDRGPPPDLETTVHALYHPRRLQLAAAHPERDLRLTDADLAAAAEALRNDLAGPAAPLLKRLVPADPLLWFRTILKRFEAARPGDLALHGDQLVTRDGRHAILFVGTRHSPLATEHQGPLLAAIADAGRELAGTLGPDVKVELAGIHPFGLHARQSIEQDVTRISIISLAAIVVIFIWLYRSLLLLLLATLPLAFGVLVGLSLGVAVYGKVHGLTLAFAATLIGVCIDYAIHLFTEHTLGPRGRSGLDTMRHIAPGLWLSAATTLIGFAALAASTLPGLGEIGVVSFGGVLGALLVTRYAVPAMLPVTRDVPAHAAALLARVDGWLAALARQRRWMLGILAAALALSLATLPYARWDDDLASLNQRDPAILAEDTAVRQRVADVEPGRVLVATGATDEEALRVTEALTERLDALVARGALAGFRSVHAFLWSASLQTRNREAIVQADLARRLPAAYARAGFRPEAFAPFLAALAAPTPDPLTWADLHDSGLGTFVRPFRLQLGERVAFLTFLRGVRDTAAIGEAAASVPGATFVDQREFMNRAYTTFRDRAALAIALGVVAIVALVALRYRRVRPALAAALPALAACGATLALLTLGGSALTLIHIVSLMLVFEMGVDYGVFMLEASRRGDGVGVTFVGLVFACATTVLGFGLLALSSQPVMRSIGLTIGVGVLTTVVLVPCVLLLVAPRSAS